MKSTIKIFLTMLCIGLSANIIADVTVENKTIERALKEYNPKKIIDEAPLSLEGAATYWAEGLVSQLTTKERTALAYHCLNNGNNQNANISSPDAIKRILKQIISAEVPVNPDNPDYTRELADTWKLTSELPLSWTTLSDIPILGRAVSLAKGAQRAISTMAYTTELGWPNLNKYLNNDKLKPIDPKTSSVTPAYLQAAMKAALNDIKSKSFQENMLLFYRQSIENIAWDRIEKELINNINASLTRTFEKNKLTVPNNLISQIETAIDTTQLSDAFNKIKKTYQPKKQTPQISTTTPTATTSIPQLPYLDRYLQKTTQHPYINYLQNNNWYNDVLTAVIQDYNMPNSTLKSMSVEDQKNLITTIIMPEINKSAKYYSITPFTAKEIYDWLSNNWPPQQDERLSGEIKQLSKYPAQKLTSNQELAQKRVLLKKKQKKSQPTKKIQDQPTTEKKQPVGVQPRRLSPKEKQELLNR